MNKNRIVVFFAAFFVWCFLSWVPDFQHIIVGILAAAFVSFVTAGLFTDSPYVSKRTKRCWYFIRYYLPVFLREVIKANIDVAYRVLHPKLPINPGIVKVKTKLKKDIALTFLANSITLTPGTMTVDIDKEKGVLYIHWINVEAKDVEGATEIIVKRFENILEKIFE